MTQTATRKIEVFRPGKFVAMGGEPCEFTADDLKAIAAAYDPEAAPAPGVVGHPKHDDPAFCWARSFTYDETGQRLIAEVGDIEPTFADAVAEKRYAKISLALFAPDAPNNPKPGAWYPKHIGFLGAAAPAVTGLKPVAFADDLPGVVTLEFGDDRAFRDIAVLFQGMREWMIEKFGSEPADKALPRWTIDWIDEAATREPPENSGTSPMFSDPAKDPVMTDKTAQPDQAALAARLAEVERRERELAHGENLAFAEALVSDGKLPPALKERAVAVLDFLGPQAGSLEFAEGDKTVKAAPALAMRELLKGLPKVVTLGKVDVGKAPPSGTIQFSAPDGATVDPEGLELHAQALAFQAQHPGTDYLAAVAAVSK